MGINKKSGAEVLTPDKTNFKTKAITRDKEGPSNSTSGRLSEETQTLTRKDVYIHMFTEALFIITKTRKQLKCP